VVFDIFSPGGDVWDGNAIIQEIGELNKRVKTTAKIQVAASMATLIAVACNTRRIAQNGRFLIHNAWTSAIGDADEMLKTAKILRDCEIEAAKFYALRTGQTEEKMTELMKEERWMMPEEVLALGFATEICDPFKPEDFAAIKQELTQAGHWPRSLVELPPEEVKEDKTNVSQTDQVPANNQAVKPPEPAQSASVVSEDYKRGHADGVVEGEVKALTGIGDQVVSLKDQLEKAKELASKYQSERDKLQKALDNEKQLAESRVSALRQEIESLSSKLREYISGALAFSAPVETWAEAMAACNGQYAEAAQKFPELLKQYRAQMAQKERR
jgi:ClpP class serine protease